MVRREEDGEEEEEKEEEKYVRIPDPIKSDFKKMPSCSHWGIEFNRLDNLQRHMKNKFSTSRH